MTKITSFIKDEYLSQTFDNPKYIFHGSSNLIETNLTPQKAKDSMNIELNSQEAIYGTSIFLNAVCYSMRKNITSCHIGDYPDNYKMIIYEGKIDLDQEGYVYVFNASDFKKSHNIQYISKKELKPIEIIKVLYKDFTNLFIDVYDYTDDYSISKTKVLK